MLEALKEGWNGEGEGAQSQLDRWAGPERKRLLNHTEEFGVESRGSGELMQGFKKGSFRIQFIFKMTSLAMMQNGAGGDEVGVEGAAGRRRCQVPQPGSIRGRKPMGLGSVQRCSREVWLMGWMGARVGEGWDPGQLGFLA